MRHIGIADGINATLDGIVSLQPLAIGLDGTAINSNALDILLQDIQLAFYLSFLHLPSYIGNTRCAVCDVLKFHTHTVCQGTVNVLGIWLLQYGVQFVMTWYGGILAAAVVAFPLMYRTARGAFESFDQNLSYAGQTLGLSNSFIFWRVRMPACRQGILAGTVLAFARALGEYGATSMLIGYTPGRTATISTTVYQLWRNNDEQGALYWVLVNLAISTVVLLTVNLLEARQKKAVKA